MSYNSAFAPAYDQQATITRTEQFMTNVHMLARVAYNSKLYEALQATAMNACNSGNGTSINRTNFEIKRALRKYSSQLNEDEINFLFDCAQYQDGVTIYFE